jgi:CBS domain-containing protein
MGLLALADATPQMPPETLVTDAVRLMTERNVGSVAVTVSRKCVGMFTERDLMRRIVHLGRDPRRTSLSDVMSHPVLAVTDSTSVAQAAELMRAHHIRHLAIVGPDGELQGVVALRYLLYALMDELEAKVGDLEGYLMADAPGG